MSERIKALEVKVDDLRTEMEKRNALHVDNTKHINILNSELGQVKTDIKWIKRYVFINMTIWIGLTGLIIKLVTG